MEEEMLKISMANRFQLRIMPESHGLFWQQKVGKSIILAGQKFCRHHSHPRRRKRY